MGLKARLAGEEETKEGTSDEFIGTHFNSMFGPLFTLVLFIRWIS